MDSTRRNRNRGYRQLRVWQDAIELYALFCGVFSKLPYVLSRVASQNMASADSVHRNIAEGYCRRSVAEYIQFLYYALGSLGESGSGLVACHRAGQVDDATLERLDALAFRLENGLLKLVEALERKRMTGDWVDTLVVQESNTLYDATPGEMTDGQYPVQAAPP
jgi:four helix bundle protein